MNNIFIEVKYVKKPRKAIRKIDNILESAQENIIMTPEI